MQGENIQVAVDIGGTFTDVALAYQADTTDFMTAKVPTTPTNPVTEALAAIRFALKIADVDPAVVRSFIHGTTLATNALIEKRGARVGVITTAGFRDILEIAYERRYNQYDIFLDKPDTLICPSVYLQKSAQKRESMIASVPLSPMPIYRPATL